MGGRGGDGGGGSGEGAKGRLWPVSSARCGEPAPAPAGRSAGSSRCRRWWRCRRSRGSLRGRRRASTAGSRSPAMRATSTAGFMKLSTPYQSWTQQSTPASWTSLWFTSAYNVLKVYHLFQRCSKVSKNYDIHPMLVYYPLFAHLGAVSVEVVHRLFPQFSTDRPVKTLRQHHVLRTFIINTTCYDAPKSIQKNLKLVSVRPG